MEELKKEMHKLYIDKHNDVHTDRDRLLQPDLSILDKSDSL